MKPLECREPLMQLMSDDVARTTRQIAEATGYPLLAVKTAIQGLHRAGELHIADWIRNEHGMKSSALWRVGSDEDAEAHITKRFDAQAVVQSLRGMGVRFGPFATAMWNVTQGERNAV